MLVVDDDPRMQEALREVLARKYAVFVAPDGLKALDMLKKRSFDVVITDLKMPGLSGLEFFKKAKRLTDAPFIFITAYGTVPTAVEAMKEGAFDFILKPFPVELVESVVAKALKYGAKVDKKKKDETPLSPEKQKAQTADLDFVWFSEAMQKVVDYLDRVAPSNATVLIEGESGTGKELAARYIHIKSGRKGAFVAVNCAAIPEGLLESELFGYEKGAFTGASSAKEGKFELANGGTLFLDEIGEMPLALQAKLLRVLQEKEVDRLGGKKPKKIDVRIVAATNKNLKGLVEKGKFREDLYYRLSVIPIKLPPLRERKEEILPLSEHFLKKCASMYGKVIMGFTEDAKDELLNYHWPGNVRELENVIERAVILCEGDEITKEDLFIEPRKERRDQSIDDISVDELEKMLLEKTLKEAGGDIKKASLILGIDPEVMAFKAKRYGLIQ
ncbi:sigma-54-dependent transcriptional regulator [Thermosulfidibacter takaii]|uniref:sigma-54-dependent transcriptional regulator n=1 Tax=Thermosulfidibacter takaii TaxID=412593 RepID=UPI001E632FC4|nr:sigma-54 dependent transcriptional regulator [Thermosulfidibacter takaii]